MNDLLKGNFKPKKEVSGVEDQESIEQRFEREALKKLGGSISFVKKQKVKWAEEPDS
jgi:hypothetical protein